MHSIKQTGVATQEELLDLAKTGDREAFSQLVEPYCRQVHIHCYHMLGSLSDADDMLQETLIRAWRGAGLFAGRASFRSWLYRIATNVCLTALAGRKRSVRVLPEQLAPPTTTNEVGKPSPEIPWLEPCPDAVFTSIADASGDPQTHVEKNEAVELAFVAAMQHLPPKQRAVLLLRDVLQCSATETAAMLDVTVQSANSALQRARVTMNVQDNRDWRQMRPMPNAQQRLLLKQYVGAWQNSDIATLITLLREESILSMPPLREWFRGRDAIGAFLATAWTRLDGPHRFVPTVANGQAAFIHYVRGAGATWEGHAIHVLTFEGPGLSALTLFREANIIERFVRPTRTFAINFSLLGVL